MNESVKRILSGTASLPFVIFSVYNQSYQSLAFALVVTFLGLISVWELRQMLFARGHQLSLILMMLGTTAIYYVYYQQLPTEYLIIILIFTLVVGLVMQLLRSDFEKVFQNLGYILFTLIYLGLMWGSIIRIKQISYRHFIVLIVATWCCDIGAYFVGITLGKHKAGIKVSPKKTYEGFIGGIFFSLLGAYLASYWSGVTFRWWFLLLPFMTILGDLVESIIKRAMGVKDSSKLVPGHGGFLDVIDAMIFTGPVYYYMLVLFDNAV